MSAVVIAVMDVVGLACGLDVEGAVGARDLLVPVGGGVSGGRWNRLVTRRVVPPTL